MEYLLRKFKELNEKKEKLKEELANIDSQLDYLNFLLVLNFTRDKVNKVSIEDRTFYLQSTVRASIADREKFIRFCKRIPIEKGKRLYSVLFIKTANANSLGKFARDMISAGKNLPKSLSVFYDTQIRARKIS